MSFYNISYISTNGIYIFSIYKLFQIFFSEDNCNKKVKKIILSTYFVGLSLIIFVTRIPIILLFVNLFFLFCISLTYRSSFQKKIIYVSLIYSITLTIELLLSVLFGFIDLSGTSNSTFNSVSILIFIRVMILSLAYFANKYVKLLKKEYKIPKMYYTLYFVVLFGSLYLFICGISSENVTIERIIISGIVLITVNITMILIDEKIYNAIILEHDQNILRQYNESLENQMEIINQSTEAIRLLKHDFKNHLIMLYSLNENCKQDEIKSYINTILGNIENESFSNSGNFVIDSIINFKLRNIKSLDIKILIDINIPITINILAYDLTAILGNILDNAITACKESNEKILEIKISSKMDNLIILMSNSHDGKIINENGNLKTTNQYKNNHGLGIKSVKKYWKNIMEKLG